MVTEKLRSAVFACVAVVFLCSWWWGVGVPRREVFTTNVEVNLVKSSLRVLNNSSSSNNVAAASFKSRPRVHHTVPKYMLDLFDLSSGNRAQAVDVIKSVMPKRTGSLAIELENFRLMGTSKCHLLVYDVPNPKTDEIFQSAEVRVPTTVVKSKLSDILGVERMIQILQLENDSKITELDKRHIVQQEDLPLTLNVTPAINSLYIQKNKCRKTKTCTTKLVLCITDTSAARDSGDVDLALISKQHVGPDIQPLLLLSYATSNKQKIKLPTTVREKRSLVDAEEYEEETNRVWDEELKSLEASSARRNKRHRNTCRRRPLYIDFAEIHYDTWIIAPGGYEAFQCLGKCFYPVGDHLSPTKHAIVQTLLHTISPSKVSRACCVPTKLDPISILYVDDNDILTYKFSYNDMVVTECGCR